MILQVWPPTGPTTDPTGPTTDPSQVESYSDHAVPVESPENTVGSGGRWHPYTRGSRFFGLLICLPSRKLTVIASLAPGNEWLEDGNVTMSMIFGNGKSSGGYMGVSKNNGPPKSSICS